MADQSLNSVVARLQHMAAADGSDTVPDCELLRRYTSQRDSAALELLVWRHGAMTLATCHRVLGPGLDAEDVFQATFLVLVRKAHTVRRQQSLAAWLHRVAYHTCLRLQKRHVLQRKSERAAARHAETWPVSDTSDLRPILDAEIARLPQRFRTAFLLCQCEGKTNDDAARLLGIPRGTLLSRLARARQRLKVRLIQRGIAPAAFAAWLGVEVDPLSAALVKTTVYSIHEVAQNSAATPSAIAVLAEGAMREMFWNKIKLVACAIVAVSLVGAVGAFLGQPGALAEADKPAKPAEKPKTNGNDDKPADSPTAKQPTPLDLLLPTKPLPMIHPDEYRMHGTWSVVEIIANGEQRDPGDMQMVFGPFQTMLVQDPYRSEDAKSLSFKLDPESGAIDLTVGGKTQAGIYRLYQAGLPTNNDMNGLSLCLNEKGDKRPTEFAAAKGSGNVFFQLRRNSYAAETKWADKLFPDGLVVDFGSVTGNEPKTVRVKIKNPYLITMWCSGGPTAGENWLTQRFAATAGPIEPGGEATMELTLNPGRLNRMGPMGGRGAGFPMGPMGGRFAIEERLSASYIFTAKNYRPKTDPLTENQDPNRRANGGQPLSRVNLTIKADFAKPAPK
jgi:RNA polymerase sigma factor (sigma-70 family)